MKLTVTILACGLAAGLASAQSPSIIQNTRATMNGVSSKATAASNQALAPASTAVATKSDAHIAPVSATSGTKHKSASKKAPGVTVKPGAVVAVPKSTTASAGQAESTEAPVTPDSKLSANGRRDPFVSPVVSHAGGSGCSTGKKCLEIGEINLRGVVHSDTGFIAVVSNGLNKAYFLRENDPVFNGFVIRITGDSIVFQETMQDRLGKSFTREVVKKITTPAV